MLSRYVRWLHFRYPAGVLERFPEVREDGTTSIPGIYVAGDLTGIPLLKFALDSGVRTVRAIAADTALRSDGRSDLHDLVIVGAGVSGMAAAVEAKKLGLSFVVLEASEAFSTIIHFPKGKPIFTYPADMKPAGDVQVRDEVHPKETLLEDLRRQAAGVEIQRARVERIERQRDHLRVHLADGGRLGARRVLTAIGRSGNFRKLGVPGENLDKVYNRLHDPAEFRGKTALVVGGGDTAIECAIALAQGGAEVTLSYRKNGLSRPKSENLQRLDQLLRDPDAEVAIEQPSSERVTTASGGFSARGTRGRIQLKLGTQVTEIRPTEISLKGEGTVEVLPNDVVFSMVGRDPPLEFFRRSGIAIAGEMSRARWIGLFSFVAACALLYNWKSGGALSNYFANHGWFPFFLDDTPRAPATLLGTLAISASGPSFWYTLLYSLVVMVFGLRRIVRRRTPYVTAQTAVLMAVQVIPLFLLPEVILPLLHHNDMLPSSLANGLFPICNYGHGRELWRAYGLVLAWPLMVYNVFTHEPLVWWLVISAIQTLGLIPLGIWFFGKGVYCGWICSCGALAETLGDSHRHKMPHGPRWNRLNLAGQAILGIAVMGLALRVTGWLLPDGNVIARHFSAFFETPYKWMVDVTLGGVVGVGCYFWFSGRVWCRFFCPLAALMHIYARFSSFAIIADKKKCISCSVCSSVCHQGIDIMNFANKGLPMTDPQCVRCSACVQSCPTAVLQFGRVTSGGELLSVDRLRAQAAKLGDAA